MANIQVNIEVNDNEFKDLCLENINDLPKDKMEELLLKAVEVALIRDKDKTYYDCDSSILVTPSRSSRPRHSYEPTELMKEIIKEINTKAYIEPLAQEVATFIKENYKEIVRDYIVEAFSKMLFSQAKEYEIKDFVFRQLHR